jgi:hypothetical protein
MKSTFCIALLYLCLSVLITSCSKNDPEPACVQADVIGPDACGSGWYVLRLNATENKNQGILPGGCYDTATYVTVNNLPEEYRQAGLKINVSLEEKENDGPLCLAVYMMYPAASIKRICSSSDR